MKKRVYQVAREQGLTSKELLGRLQAAGIQVTTPSSNVDAALALRALDSSNGATPTAAAPETTAPPKPTPPKSKRFSSSVWLSFSATLLAVVTLSGLVGWALSSAFSSSPAFSTSPSGGPRSGLAAGLPQRSLRGWSSVAVAKSGQLTAYSRPSAQTRMLTLTKPNPTQPLTLLVKQRRGGWVQTYLPMRPNGSLAWVRSSAVRLLTDPYALVIRLRSHRLVLKRADRVIRTFPIAVGKPSTPTPTGHFFLTELLKQPDPAGPYGPYAFGTSDFSDVIKHFGNGGNGQIGIHGTDQPWVIGTSASHGCIRLYNRDIVWLAGHIPLGTPVRVSA